MNNKVNFDIEELREIKEKIRTLSINQQKEELKKASPYSDDITSHIQSYDELRLYYSLQLRERFVTRPVLVADVDPDLWVASEGATNLELMKKGNAPYLFDAPEGKFELHHIGQDYNSPFAELTKEDHDSNNQILHIAGKASWRNDPNAEQKFTIERKEHWIKRAKGETFVCDLPNVDLSSCSAAPRCEYLLELRELCEEIYRQSDKEDLEYLADLAKSYAMMSRIGALTIGGFLKNNRNEREEQIRCSFCSCTDYVLYGTYRGQGEKVQRYRCKKCGTIFTATAKTLLAGSSFSFKDWLKFIDCLYNGFTLKQTAKTCSISEKTAHENRAKLFFALKLLNDKVKLEGNIAIDETFLPVSFKGNHSKQEGFNMPRKPNKRGGENRSKGISDNLVCIVCAIDDAGNSVCEVCGTGNPSASKLNYVLKQHIGDNVVCFYSDKSSAIRTFAQSCGYEIKQDKLLLKDGKHTSNIVITRDTFLINRYIQKVNNYHSRLKRFLSRFSGISTKYLSGYIYLFAWKERNRDKPQEDIYRELLQVMAEPSNYLSAEDLMNGGYLPDAIKINNDYKKRALPPTERDLSIGRKYAAGQTMASIGAEYNMTKQNVHLILKKLKEAGIRCMPAAVCSAEQEPKTDLNNKIKKKVLQTLARDYQIYDEKLRWAGSATEFNQKMSQKYGISEQRVKNVIALIKRFIRLKEEIFIYENISYQTLGEVYRSVYSDYLEFRKREPDSSQSAHIELLAEKYSFRVTNIRRIIGIMSEENSAEYFNQKRKLSKTETYNRDKAVFIDYLRWIGIRSDFCRYAAGKYNISRFSVNTILKYCLYADPKRNEMV